MPLLQTLEIYESRVLTVDDPQLQDALAAVHETPERPRCLCVVGGVEMYVARHRQFVVKRMPETGGLHHPSCASYEPEAQQSGLAQVGVPRRRMSLRSLTHYLFERAGFNRWSPAMEGRRNQGVIHKYLHEAAADVLVKGLRLCERLYVPEPFSEARSSLCCDRTTGRARWLL